jgi:sulfite reductase alpha subunit-like flavoprotein
LSAGQRSKQQDIENALLQVIREEGQLSKEDAKKYLKQLERTGMRRMCIEMCVVSGE